MKEDKHHVSIKVNGKKLTEQEDPPHDHDQEHPTQESPAIIDWKEKRLTEREEAASIVEEDNQKKRPGLPIKSKRKKKAGVVRPSIYFLSITAGAVVIGLLFGVMILQLFPAEAEPTAGTKTEEAPPVTASYEERLTASFIQAGAFTGEEKATEMQEVLLEKGYPGMLTHDGEWYYLFVGAAFEEKQVKELLNLFEEDNIEVFEKERAIAEPVIKDGAKQEREWLLESKNLLMETTTSETPDEQAEAFEQLLTEAESWKNAEEAAYAEWWSGLENVQEVLSEDEEGPVAMTREMMEAIIYYEEAILAFNEDEEAKSNES